MKLLSGFLSLESRGNGRLKASVKSWQSAGIYILAGYQLKIIFVTKYNAGYTKRSMQHLPIIRSPEPKHIHFTILFNQKSSTFQKCK